MKKFILCFLSSLMLTPIAFSAQGGPDAYGYTWIDSNEPGGPVFNWIDITPSGNVVNGLLDDNSVAAIPIGIDFHYYWGDYNELKIGSNGWVGFDNIGNIAHCFPSLPTAGGAGDNFLAPFMTDLNFDAVGNPAYCMYHYILADSVFVISYMDVPWWTATAPNYAGQNSFQIILDAKDSSITYQYLMTDPGNFNDMAGCPSDIGIGIEGPTGAYGLQVFQDSIPPTNYAIKFIYPNPVLIDVPDITPDWLMNTDNGAEFRFNNQNATIPVNIKNVGNVDVTTDITVNVIVQDEFATTVASFNTVIAGGLAFGADTTLQYNWTPSAGGQYGVGCSVVNSEDINFTNNVLWTEIEVQDPGSGVTRFSYINDGEPLQSTIAWNSGSDDGVATRFIPNSYPVVIDSIGGFVGGTGDVQLDLYADDGPNGMPGTLLHSETFPAGSVTLSNWIVSTLPVPDTIYSGGFYVAWIQPGTGSTYLGTITTAPFSRRNLEYINGWATYRDNETQDFMLEAWAASLCSSLTSSSTFTQTSCAGASDGSIDLTPTGGTPPYTYSWTGGAGTTEDPSGLSAGPYIVTITDSVGCQHVEMVIITEPLPINIVADSTDDEIAGSDGAIYITVSGGTAPYTYNWTGGAGTSEDPTGLAGGPYTVTVTDANGCTDTLTVTVNSQLNFDNYELTFNIYPNPSDGLINVQINNSDKTLKLVVEDITGRVIISNQLIGQSTVQLDLSNKAEGAYFISLSDGESLITKKIVIQR